MTCGRELRLPGGFYYRVRRAVRVHRCFRCRGTIAMGELYVEERPYMGDPRRYHIKCFEATMDHRLRVRRVGGELCLSTA